MNSKGLLVGSVLLNIGLVCTIAWLQQKKSATQPETVVREMTITNTSTRFQPVAAPGQTNQVKTSFDWRVVESEDYKEYIANLRAIGCPEETIRDIIIADVNKLFESRRKELSGGQKFEFWKTGNMFAMSQDEELTRKRQDLAREKKALLKELLGIDVEQPEEIAAANPFNAMMDFLPPEKQAAVSQLMQDFQNKMVKSMGGGAPDAEDMKNLLKVQREFDAELAAVLTPSEFEDYQLRLSQTAMVMRMQLGTFEPNEQEFRDIFKIRKAFEDEFGIAGMAALTPDEKERRKLAEEQMKQQTRSSLGEARYNDYVRSADRNYQGIVKFADRNGVSRDVATQLYETEQASKEQIRKVNQDNSIDATQREALLHNLKEQTQSQIRQLLGETAFQAYTNRPNFR